MGWPMVLTLALVILNTVLPLAVVLPKAPPLTDDATPARTVSAPRTIWPSVGGWRITLTVARRGLESSDPS